MDLASIADWTTLCLLVMVLGMRHGFDADHLATIDGLTRHISRSSPGRARYCGTLFSVGHGMVVVVIAVALSLTSSLWRVPEWFETVGTVVSIGFLLLLGMANLAAVFSSPADSVVIPVGIKARLFERFYRHSSPFSVAAVGALFAFSFDTLSQAALFAVISTQFGGLGAAVQLGLLFMLGMLVVDGANGFWISRLLQRADSMAIISSRVMSLVVASISLMIAAFAISRFALPSLARWSEGKEVYLGVGIVLMLTATYLLASRLNRVAVSRA